MGSAASKFQNEYQAAVDDDKVFVYDDSNPESANYQISRSGPALFTGHVLRYDPSESGLITGKTTTFRLVYDQIEQTSLYADDGDNV